MASTPAGLRRAAWLLALVALPALTGCPRAAPPAAAPPDDAARLNAAAKLHHDAQAAPVPKKFELYRRLIAIYGDTPPGIGAHLDLVIALNRDHPPHTEDSLEVARTFAERHPRDPRVGEAFRDVVDTAWRTKEDKVRAAALEAWEEHLVARDVGDDMPKADVFSDFVRLRLRQERWEDAEVAIDTALGEPELPADRKVEFLVRKGTLLAEKLGRKDEGCRAFTKALDLSRSLWEAKAPRPGIPPAQIEAEMEKVGCK